MKPAVAETVLRGHPDKVADQIADAILDDYIKQDPNAQVACEVIVKANTILIAGEISSSACSLYEPMIRSLIEKIGYKDASWGMDYKTCDIQLFITEQSPEIASTLIDGTGDQAIVYGYATDETDEFLPLPYVLAQKLATELSLNPPFPFLRPDGKILCCTKEGKLDKLLLSVQHDESVKVKEFDSKLIDYIHTLFPSYTTNKTQFFINPSGSFHIGGPLADTGVTGRKIMVDTYGTQAPHGGGAFSGKDPTKIDRSGAYAARYIAKNIVAKGLASKCLVEISYGIGIANPINLVIETSSNSINLNKLVQEHFPLELNDIIETFDLKRAIYTPLAFGGHFGHHSPWEKLITF